MRPTHRTTATLVRYFLLALMGSVAFQMTDIWPEMIVVLIGLGVIGTAYAFVFGVRYFGLFKGARWASNITLHDLDDGLLEFLPFAACLGGGVLLTWMIGG